MEKLRGEDQRKKVVKQKYVGGIEKSMNDWTLY